MSDFDTSIETEDMIRPHLGEVVEIIRERVYLPEYRAGIPPEECLGVAIAKYLEWTGSSILLAFFSALEDANYSTLAGKVEEWIEEEKKRA